MQYRALIPILILCLTSLSARTWADEKEDAAQLDQLMAKVKSLLPAGWEVAFEIANDFRHADSRPMLIVRSREKLPVEYVPNAGGLPSNWQPPIVHEHVTIEFEFVPYMTPEEYQRGRKTNDDFERARRQYEEARLGKKQSHYKGGFKPNNYASRTGDNSPVVREYAFLWLRTEPTPLPTHHFGTLAVKTRDLPPINYGRIVIHDARKNVEYNEILNALTKLLVPYDQPRHK